MTALYFALNFKSENLPEFYMKLRIEHNSTQQTTAILDNVSFVTEFWAW